MIESRAQKVRRGLYGGGRLPPPYVIDKHAWKEERKPIIYHSWLEPARTLFQKFHEYDFSLARVAAYIDSIPYLFPQPAFEDTHRYLFTTKMRLVYGGYTISSPDSLRNYLSNLTLGGFAKIGRDEAGNELLLPNAFEPAIPLDLLEPAYASITGHYLDGSSFEQSRRLIRPPAGRKDTWHVQAALHGFLTSKDGSVSISAKKRFETPTYLCHEGLRREGWEQKNRIGLMKQRTAWSVACEELDSLVLDRLFELVRYDIDMVKRIKTFWELRKTDEMDEAQLLKQQIHRAEEQIARLDHLLTDPTRPLSKMSEDRYLKLLSEVEADVARLKRQQSSRQTIEDPQSIIPSFYYVLAHLPTEYQKLSAVGQKKLLRIVTKVVQLDMASQHLFKLYIVWENGIAVRPDVALVWRGVTPNKTKAWSEEEDTILKLSYLESSQLELMQALPHRAWNRIGDRANAIGFKRPTANLRSMYHRTVSYADLEAIMQHAEGEEERARVCQVVNELAKRTMRGGLSAYWWLPLSGISYAGIGIEEAADVINLDLFNVSDFPSSAHRPGESPRR